MRSRPFAQIDVFTDQACLGNPLAVVMDGDSMTTEDMQRFTDWTHLSEATFLLPPTPEGAAAGADYRVRIFCPGRELPFAGHPTLGSAHAWLQAGGAPRRHDTLVQECGAGLVTLRRDGPRLAFAAPPLRRSGPLDEADVVHMAQGLGIARADIRAHAWCDNGPGWRTVLLDSAEQVLALQPDPVKLAGWGVGVVAPHSIAEKPYPSSTEADFDYVVRAFFPGVQGLAEDPVTGSLNAAIAQWLMGAGLAPHRYVAAQGQRLNRQGCVHLEREPDGTIWVGGQSVTVISGVVTL